MFFLLAMLLGFLFCAGLAAALLGGRDRYIQFWWSRAAERLGLGFRRGGLLGDGDNIVGELDEHRVVFDNHLRHSTSATLECPDVIPREVTISRRRWVMSDGRDTRKRTGDKAFDRVISVAGPADELVARLDRRARSRLIACFDPAHHGGALEVKEGTVLFTAPAVIKRLKRLRAITETLVNVREALRVRASIPEELRRVAFSGDEPMMLRLNSLRALINVYSDALETKATCVTALEWPDPEARLIAAIHLDEDPRAITCIIDLAVAEVEPIGLRISALRHLMRLDAEVNLMDVLKKAAASAAPQIRAVAARSLGELPPSAQAKDCLMMLALDTDPQVLVAVCEGFVAFTDPHDPMIQDVLINYLEYDAMDVRWAAIDGLGSIGNLSAVEPLHALQKRILTSSMLKKAAREAIQKIQSGQGHVEGGRLSLSDGPSGALTMVQNAQGDLGFPEEE